MSVGSAWWWQSLSKTLRSAGTKILASVVVGLCSIPSDHLQWVPEAPDIEEPSPLGSLVDLVVQRLLIGRQIAAAKFWTGSPVVDPERESSVLRGARVQAEQLGLDGSYASRFFYAQLLASRTVQRSHIARWTSRPMLAPMVWPDIQEVRGRLDLMDLDLVWSLLEVRELALSPLSLAIDLYNHRLRAADSFQLDSLYRRVIPKALAALIH
jgi:chorismate mutase